MKQKLVIWGTACVMKCSFLFHVLLLLLSKIRKFISAFVRLYKSLIMSRLQYGCFFYANALKKEQQQLQKIQNMALCICYLAT